MAKRNLPYADDVDGSYYYAMYPDVAAAGAPPARHYHRFGWHEGRNPDSYFDTLGYLTTYRDVAAAGIDPLAHFHQFGWREGREPSPAFDAQAYLAANPDVAAAGIDPLAHYLRFGRAEGRAVIAKPLYDADGTANAVNEHAGAGSATGVTFSWGGFISPNLHYTLVGDTSGGGFQVNASTGAVTIADPSKVDYNTSGPSHSYTVTVQASDLGHTITQTAVIAIRDVNDFAPVFTSGTTGQEAENTAATNVVYAAHATDADGTAPNNTVTYSLTAGVGDNDQFAINATTGAVTFKASPDYEHPTDGNHDNIYNIVVTAIDGGTPALSATRNVTITVTDVNDNAPVFTNGGNATATTPENVSTMTPVYTAAATDADGTAPNKTVTYSLAPAVSDNDQFTINPTTGAVTFNASPDYEHPTDSGTNNTYDIVVTATDGGATPRSTTQNVAITVTNVNDNAPVANPDSYQTNEDTTLTILAKGVLANDSDADGDPLTSIAVSLPHNGQVTLNPDGSFTYKPNADFNGIDSFTYKANDGTNQSTPTTVTINVIAVNDAPSFTLASTTATSNEDAGPQTVAGFATAISPGPADESGQLLKFITTNDNNALFSVQPIIDANGNLTYTANANANGTATVTVQLHDNGGTANSGTDTSASQTFTITVGAVNDAPSFTLPSNTTGSNEDAGAQTVAGFATNISAGPANESTQTVSFVVDGSTNPTLFALGGAPAIDANGNLTYTAAANANGTATVTVQLHDNGGTANSGTDTSASQTFTITVGAVNDAPSFTLPSNTTGSNEDAGAQTVAGFATNISAGPANESTQTVSFVVDGNTNPTLFALGGGPAIDANGNLTYTAAANANGTATISVHAMDNGGTANSGTDSSASQTFTITVGAVNDAPSFTLPSNTTGSNEDAGAQTVAGFATNISAGPANESTQTVSFVVDGNTNPTLFALGGAPAIDANGNLTYTAAANANGTATISVHAMDNGGTANSGTDSSASQTFTITVGAVNDAPTATGLMQSLAINEDAAATNLFTTAPTVSDVDSPTVNATLTLANAAAGVLTGAGTGTTAGGATTYTITGSPAAVQAALAAVQFDSADNYFGTTSVAVAITDGQNGPQGTNPSGTVSITIASVNDAPAGTDKTISGVGPHTFELADFGFTDPNDAAGPGGANGLYAVEITSLPTSGTLTLSGQPVHAGNFIPRAQIGGGFLVFTPDNSGATATFTFQVQDDGGKENGGQDTDQSPNTITLSPNTPPTANADNITATEAGGTANGTPGHNPTGNVVTAMGGNGPNGEVADTDAEDGAAGLVVVKAGNGASPAGTDASVTSAGIAVIGSHGTLTIKSDGSYTYAVNQDDAAVNALNSAQSLPDTFHYTVQDSGGLTSSAAINVTINGANDAPIAQADAIDAQERGGFQNQTAGLDPSFNIITGAGEPALTPPATHADSDPDNADTITVQGVATGTVGGPITGAVDMNGNYYVPSANGYGALQVAPNGNAVYYVAINSSPAVQALRTYDQTLQETFSYTIKDSGGLTSTTQVVVTIHGQNDNPVANPDTGTATEGGGTNNTGAIPASGNVLSNDTDPDSVANGETQTVQGVAAGNVGGTQTQNVGSTISGTYGTLTLGATGIYTYNVTESATNSLALGQSATDVFTYTIHDAVGATSTSKLTITVNGANDAPVANAISAPTNEDVGRSITLQGNDPDGSVTSYKITALPSASAGTLYSDAGYTTTISAGQTVGQTVYFKPAANYSGTGSFQYAATDNDGLTGNAATVTIDISPVADQATFSVGSLQPTVAQGTVTTTMLATGTLSGSAVATISGGYAVAFGNVKADASTAEIDLQRYTSTGAVNGALIHVTTANTDVGSQVFDSGPNMEKLSNGGFIVVWERSPDAADQTDDIVGRIYDANGNPAAGGEFTIANGLAALKSFEKPQIAVLNDGSFVVTYEFRPKGGSEYNSGSHDNVDVYAQHLTSTGALSGAAFQVPTATAGGQLNPDVVALSDGGFLVVWQADVNTAAGSGNVDNDIHAQRYAVSGNTISAVHADGTTSGAQEFSISAINTGAQSVPSVAALPTGGWVVTWQSPDSGGVNSDIHVRVFSATGDGGSEITVNTSITGNQTSPNIVTLPDGGFVVTWTDGAVSGGDIEGQRFDATGQMVGGQFVVNGAASGQSQYNDALAALGNGDIVSNYADATANNPVHSTVFNIPGDGVQNVETPITTLTAAVTDSGETLSYHITGFSPGATFNKGSLVGGEWVISNTADISYLQSNPLTITSPTAGTYTLSIDAQTTDTATLSSGSVTSAPSHNIQTIAVGIHTTADPVFAAHDAGPFDLHLSAVADTATVHIDALPDNGQIAYADGTLVTAGANLSGHELAGLKFTPTDTAADHAANLIYTVSNGTSVDTQTLPIYVQHGSNLTLTGTAEKDVIVGGSGSDTLIGNGGGNFLTGGGGADTFVFDAKALSDASGPAKFVDHITDYSAAQHDTIDVTALIAKTAVPATQASDLVHVTANADGTSASLTVNTGGTGDAAHWVEIAHLDGVQAGDTVDVALDAAHPQQVSHIHVEGWAHA